MKLTIKEIKQQLLEQGGFIGGYLTLAIYTPDGFEPIRPDQVHISVELRETPALVDPIPMIMFCPCCGERHIDEGEFATRVHHSHACQNCGMVWRPAIVSTTGVQFLPGFKSEPKT